MTLCLILGAVVTVVGLLNVPPLAGGGVALIALAAVLWVASVILRGQMETLRLLTELWG